FGSRPSYVAIFSRSFARSTVAESTAGAGASSAANAGVASSIHEAMMTRGAAFRQAIEVAFRRHHRPGPGATQETRHGSARPAGPEQPLALPRKGAAQGQHLGPGEVAVQQLSRQGLREFTQQLHGARQLLGAGVGARED